MVDSALTETIPGAVYGVEHSEQVGLKKLNHSTNALVGYVWLNLRTLVACLRQYSRPSPDIRLSRSWHALNPYDNL